MITQNHVLLSLGSNLGNRLQYLQQAVDAVHCKLGTVIRLSSVYETPPWGFESTPFYNCLISIHTYKTPEEVLKGVLAIEKKLGRVRSGENGYSARTIDIDIITFNEETIVTKDLIIPHPRLHERNFVMVPLAEIVPDWQHPELNESIGSMLNKGTDASVCVKTAVLENPLSAYTFDHIRFMAIEGNIGAGKTTLANKIAEDFNAKPLLERFADNPFLPKFYKDPQRYAFSLEMSFLADRYSQLAEDLNQLDLFHDFIISDYYIYKSLIFAEVTLEEEEFTLYRNIFNVMYKETPKPDLYVYLNQQTHQLVKNIEKRGRDYENEINLDYFEKINLSYRRFMDSAKDHSVLLINMEGRDFVNNQQDYLYILDQIQKKITDK